MLDRIARFCVRRRGIVLIAWIGILVVTSVVANGIVRADYRADMKLPDSESRRRPGPAGSSQPEPRRVQRADRVRGAAGRRRPRGRSARWRTCSRRSTSSTASTSPARTRPRARRRSARPRRSRSPSCKCATASTRSSLDLGTEIEDLGNDVASRRTDRRVRRRHVLEVRDARERGARVARRDHHPADRVRFGARDGPADRHRAVRTRAPVWRSRCSSATCSRCPTSRRSSPR